MNNSNIERELKQLVHNIQNAVPSRRQNEDIQAQIESMFNNITRGELVGAQRIAAYVHNVIHPDAKWGDRARCECLTLMGRVTEITGISQAGFEDAAKRAETLRASLPTETVEQSSESESSNGGNGTDGQGAAGRVSAIDFDNWNKDALISFANDNEIEIDAKGTKKTIADTIRAAVEADPDREWDLPEKSK